MSSPLGSFVRAKRQSIRPETVGLPVQPRRRAPGLRRTEVAQLAGISVEYLTRLEQGSDRNPSTTIIGALARALELTPAEGEHLRYLAKISGGACAHHPVPAPPDRSVRREVRAVLDALEPALAYVTNRIGDVIAATRSFTAVFADTGLLDAPAPNLTVFVFTDQRARTLFPEWEHVADERAFDLWLGPDVQTAEWFISTLAPAAGPELTARLGQHLPPAPRPLLVRHPAAGDLVLHREVLELSRADAQQIVVLLPADDATGAAVHGVRSSVHQGRLGETGTLHQARRNAAATNSPTPSAESTARTVLPRVHSRR